LLIDNGTGTTRVLIDVPSVLVRHWFQPLDGRDDEAIAQLVRFRRALGLSWPAARHSTADAPRAIPAVVLNAP
jgi:hypothetical protein